MKTAGRETPNRRALPLGNRAQRAEGQNRSCSIKWAAKVEKFRPWEKFFFLTFPFIEQIWHCELNTARACCIVSLYMPTNHVDEQLNLHRNLGVTRPPEKVTQEAFEGDDRHLRRLARLRPGEVADGDDLWKYVHDLRNTDIQTPLFVYLLPFCLKAWRDDLRGFEGHGGIVEHFYAVLADRHVF